MTNCGIHAFADEIAGPARRGDALKVALVGAPPNDPGDDPVARDEQLLELVSAIREGGHECLAHAEVGVEIQVFGRSLTSVVPYFKVRRMESRE
jgi:hypothetical protein